MDIHPSKDIIVTAAQDCTLAVWQLPIAMAKVRQPGVCMHGGGTHNGLLDKLHATLCRLCLQAACLHSACSLHDVLTGVAFCGDSNDDVAAVAYDTEALLLWRLDSS